MQKSSSEKSFIAFIGKCEEYLYDLFLYKKNETPKRTFKKPIRINWTQQMAELSTVYALRTATRYKTILKKCVSTETNFFDYPYIRACFNLIARVRCLYTAWNHIVNIRTIFILRRLSLLDVKLSNSKEDARERVRRYAHVVHNDKWPLVARARSKKPAATSCLIWRYTRAPRAKGVDGLTQSWHLLERRDTLVGEI